ncbi:hypothetical protein I4U23_016673 [Adineta vaga]|nr:hypothetical protein I4U23_016673 [Adineta vaga]
MNNNTNPFVLINSLANYRMHNTLAGGIPVLLNHRPLLKRLGQVTRRTNGMSSSHHYSKLDQLVFSKSSCP